MNSPSVRSRRHSDNTFKVKRSRSSGRFTQRGLVTLTFNLLTSKVVSEARVTWATSGPILVFLGLSVLDLGPMYETDRQTSDIA